MNEESLFVCPVCRKPLKRREKTYECPEGHGFDRAKSGYVNLLLPGDKHSKAPGDNKLMVTARQNFLNKGYYEPLSKAVCERAADCVKAIAGRSAVLLDTGCGEGYYTAALQQSLDGQGLRFHLSGIDISKEALDRTAKRCRGIVPAAEFAVASAFHLPVGDEACDMVFCLFAPCQAEEVRRVIRPGGWLIMVVPGERHLIEMKTIVYDRPYANEAKAGLLDGFAPAIKTKLEYGMKLSCAADIANLFTMTPYYYKTRREDAERLLALSELSVTASFEIRTYKRETQT